MKIKLFLKPTNLGIHIATSGFYNGRINAGKGEEISFRGRERSSKHVAVEALNQLYCQCRNFEFSLAESDLRPTCISILSNFILPAPPLWQVLNSLVLWSTH